MATVIEFSITVAILFGFLARRYGGWVGLVAAGSLLCMPRVFGQAHLIDTDIPGLMLWAMATCAFWKGLNEPAGGAMAGGGGRPRRPGVRGEAGRGAGRPADPGMARADGPAAIDLPPGRLRRGLGRDGLITTGLMLAPLALAYLEIRRLEIALLRLQRHREPVGQPDRPVPRAPDHLDARRDPGPPPGRLGRPPLARPPEAELEALGARTAGPGDLDGDPGPSGP